MLTAIAFLVLLLVLVLIHEGGHALLARWNGCRVEEFGFGFPPRLFRFKRGETVYSFNVLPLGGFVRLTGEDEQTSTDPRSFAAQSRARRALIVAGGIMANLLLAVFLFTVVVGIGREVPVEGTERAVRDRRVEVVDVQATPVLQAAGLRPGDILLAVNDAPTTTAADAARLIRGYAGDRLTLTIRRAGETRVLALQFRPPKASEQRVGIGLLDLGTIRVPWHQAPREGVVLTLHTVRITVGGLARTFRDAVVSRKAPRDIAGPVGIATLTGAVAQRGAVPFLELLAVLSVNLALVNALPIPALDGGRLLFLLLDAVGIRGFRGRPERLAHAIGFVLLLLLLALITVGDLQRLRL